MNKPQEKKVLGIISIIFGGLALILSWMPIVNNFAAILAVVGIILGIIGIFINRKNKKLLSIIGVVISIISIIIVLGTQSMYSKGVDDAFGKSSESDKTSSKANDKSSESKSSNKIVTNITNGDPINIDNVTLKVTSWKVIQPGETGNEYGDKPIIAFWYDATNNSDEDVDPDTAWITKFEAYQDNNSSQVNKLNVGNLPDEAFLDTQDEKIKKGATAKNAVSYELDDMSTPVKLESKNIITGKVVARETIKIN